MQDSHSDTSQEVQHLQEGAVAVEGSRHGHEQPHVMLKVSMKHRGYEAWCIPPACSCCV